MPVCVRAGVAIAHTAPTSDLDELHCFRCGYLLKGLNINGQCPECGMHIIVSRAEQRFALIRRKESQQLSMNALSVLALIGSLIAFNTFTCACGRMDMTSMLVSAPTAMLAWIPFVFNRETRLGSRILRMLVVVVATMVLAKNGVDVMWFGHDPLWPGAWRHLLR